MPHRTINPALATLATLATLAIAAMPACFKPKAPEYPTTNPLGGEVAHAERNVTPIGYECKSNHNMTFELSATPAELCIKMHSADFFFDDQAQMPKAVETRLRVDAETSAAFKLEPDGVPSPVATCSVKTDGSRIKQWVTQYRGCVANQGLLVDQSQRIEVLFPETSGDAPFVAWVLGAAPSE